jgi:hypothetical protein
MTTKVVDRAELLGEYQQLAEALKEANALLEASPDDEDTIAIAEEIRQQLAPKAAALNNSETVIPTPNVAVRLLPLDPASATPGSNQPRVFVTTSAAPYQVLYDKTVWYSCVVLSAVQPASPIDRMKFKVGILGYPVTEVVFSEELRPWQRQDEILASGVACHAICPSSGLFRSCVVDRITPHNTVFVTFQKQAECGAEEVGPEGAVEVPLSHLRLGKVYKELKKKAPPVALSAEELQQRKREAAVRKRERDGQKRQQKADVCAQNSSEWKDLLKGVGGF